MLDKDYMVFSLVSYDNLPAESVELARRVNSVLADIFMFGNKTQIKPETAQVANIIKVAYVAELSTGSYVNCYLDKNDSNLDKTKVNCLLSCGGTNISVGSPTLCVGDRLYVAKFVGEWWCLHLFNG